MLVDGAGGVRELVLPTREDQADRLAADWAARAQTQEGAHGVAER
jgi:hypothetical protein